MAQNSIQLLPEEQKTIIEFDSTEEPLKIKTFDQKFIKRLVKANATLIEHDEVTGKHVFSAPKNLLMLKTLSGSDSEEE
jgi:hypothetical protein